MYVIPPRRHDTGSWTPSSCQTKTYLVYIVTIMAADDLAAQGAMASTSVKLTYLKRDKPTRKGLKGLQYASFSHAFVWLPYMNE